MGTDRRPDIFILGVQKCGTTTLSDALTAHSDVFVPAVKETYFFCDEALYAKGTDWYVREFFSAPAAQVAPRWAEATPFYLASENALERLAAYTSPEARFVVTLRDPAKRAYSSYWHQIRLQNEELSFADALDAEAERVAVMRAVGGRWWRHAYVEIGRYASQLERAFDVLGQDRILVMTQDELAHPDAIDASLTAHLALASPLGLGSIGRSNAASMPRSRMMHRLITRDNILKRVARKLIGKETRSKIGQAVRDANLTATQQPPMTTADAARLHAAFADDLRALEKLGIAVPASWTVAPSGLA